MKKMESKKLQRPRWLNSLFGPKNSNSKWLQDNLEEMNRNFRRMLIIIEDSNAESFAKKFEMYHQSKQELINLVDKCYRIHCLLAERYNHETGELLNNIPTSGLIRISNNVSYLPLLSKLRSSKQPNAPVCSVVSRQLKRGVSSKGNNNHIRGKISKNTDIRRNSPLTMAFAVRHTLYRDSSSSNLSNYNSDTQSNGDGDDEELEAELRDMIVKLYIEMEGDRVDKALLEEKLVHSKGGLQSKQPESNDSFSRDTQSDDNDDEEELQDEGSDELEAELHDMKKLHILMERDRVVSKSRILRYEDCVSDYYKEYGEVKESVKLELNVHSKGGQSQQPVKISTRPDPMPAPKKIIRFSLPDNSFSSNDDSYTHSDNDEEELQHEGTDDELEAELHDMIEKLYIEMEGDRVVSNLQGEILRYQDNMNDEEEEEEEEFRQVRESISSDVDKALLQENLELQAEICRLLKDISSLEEYNEESNERCKSLDEALSQARAEISFGSEVEQLKASIVKNNDVEELNNILEAVVAERDHLKARVAMLEA